MNSSHPEKNYFTSLEARVIACLMEKHLTTPNNYPLTLNSLILACNQKSNREPVMNLTEGQVGHTVNTLKDRGLVGVDYGGRSNHISHRVMNALSLNKQKQAIITVLMLRKPQTLNEIKTRTQRMVDFADANEIHHVLEKMMQGEKPLVLLVPKAAGSREDRYTHTLCGEEHLPLSSSVSSDNQTTIGKKINITQRLKLEERIEVLEKKVEELIQFMKKSEDNSNEN